MPVAKLNNFIETAKARVAEVNKKADINDMAANRTPFSVDESYGEDNHQDQYNHYRGRFYSAARLISSRLSSQPVLVGRRSSERNQNSADQLMSQGYIPASGIPSWLGDPRSIEVLHNHPLATTLADPNKNQTSYNFWEMICGSIMATGRGFIVAMPSVRKGKMWDLFPIPATWMKPISESGLNDKWRIKPPASAEKGIEVDADMVAHAYFSDPSNPAGAISPLTMVARSVLTDEAIASAQYSEFRNEAMPKVALIAGDVMNETGFTDDPNRTSAARPVRLDPDQRNQLITWFQQQYTGAKKRGLPIVLDAIIRDIKILSRNPAEMAYVESSGLTKEQIFEGVGVSKILTGQLEGVTRASGALAEQFFMDYCFNPIATMLSQAMTKKLGPIFSVKDDERLLAWIAPGVHRDPEVDIQYLKMGVRSYALQRNEVRDILSKRFGGIPRLEGFDDVIIPEKLEERLPSEDKPGVGRLALEQMALTEDQEEG